METWGAQGGSIDSLNSEFKEMIDLSKYKDGYGGFSSGNINLISNKKIYINIGGKGSLGVETGLVSGGYNGGGYGFSSFNGACAGASTEKRYHASGGGATHIATKSGLLSTLENSKDSIIMVSGGGGGSYSLYGMDRNEDVPNYIYPSGGGFEGGYISSGKHIDSKVKEITSTQNSGASFGKAMLNSGVVVPFGVSVTNVLLFIGTFTFGTVKLVVVVITSYLSSPVYVTVAL